MKPLLVGGVGSDDGVGSSETPVYAHAGRFLASYDRSDGEGGPDADVTVLDLRRRRAVAFLNLACCEGVPPLRLAPDGTLAVLAPGDGLLVKAPGSRARTLAGESARDLAMHGGTVYWTEGGQARSATLAGVGGGEATALEPVRLRRRGPGCAAEPGRTIAASGSVRVFSRGGRRIACRAGSTRRFRVPGDRPPRIASDRWLLVRRGATARVIDTRTGREGPPATGVVEAVLQADGGLAWLDASGQVIGQWPGSGPHLLSGPGATRLAAARRRVYWTRDGVAASWRVARPLPD